MFNVGEIYQQQPPQYMNMAPMRRAVDHTPSGPIFPSKTKQRACEYYSLPFSRNMLFYDDYHINMNSFFSALSKQGQLAIFNTFILLSYIKQLDRILYC